MAEISKERMAAALARAKQEITEEVQGHKDEDKDLDQVVGGAEEPLWEIGVIYKTGAAGFEES